MREYITGKESSILSLMAVPGVSKIDIAQMLDELSDEGPGHQVGRWIYVLRGYAEPDPSMDLTLKPVAEHFIKCMNEWSSHR